MQPREFMAVLGGIGGSLAAWPLAVRAQKSLPRIGWLVFGDAKKMGPVDQSLKDALAQAGLIDGRNVEIVFRYANGMPDRLAELATELAEQRPTLLLAVGGDVIKPLFEASKGSIPIVGGVSDSPIRSGIAVSLFNPQHFDDEVAFARRGAESLDLELTTHPIDKIADLDAALQGVEASRADGLLIISSRLTGIVAAKIAQHGQERRLPVIASWREFTDSGALLSYGPSRTFEAKRLVGYVQRVLNGAKPADLPIEQPVKFELVINLKTAKVLGLTVPPSLLGRADDVIE